MKAIILSSWPDVNRYFRISTRFTHFALDQEHLPVGVREDAELLDADSTHWISIARMMRRAADGVSEWDTT